MTVSSGEQPASGIDENTGEFHIVQPGSFADELARQAAEQPSPIAETVPRTVSRTQRVLEYLGLTESHHG